MSALGVFVLIAGTFLTGAWRGGRRFRGRGIVAAWLLAAALFGAFMAYRGRQRHLTFSFGAGTQHVPTFASFTLLGLAAFGLAALSVRRRLARHDGSLPTVADYLAGTGAFLLGLLLAVVAGTALDLGIRVGR